MFIFYTDLQLVASVTGAVLDVFSGHIIILVWHIIVLTLQHKTKFC